MGFEDEQTLVVLSADETSILGFLDPETIQTPETNELYKFRELEITHPIIDKDSSPLRYDTILVNGNKIYREKTADGDSCLYVIRGPKKYNKDKTITIKAVEVASELGQNNILRSDAFNWTVNNTFINNNYSTLFDAGTITGPGTATKYSGALTPLSILREIEKNTGGEFAFRYIYDTNLDVIKRYIDFYTQIGKSHNTIIEVGVNTDNIEFTVDEDNVAIAAGPTGSPSSSTDSFHQNMKAFEDYVVAKGASIPAYYSKNESGVLTAGPNITAPYAKVAGKGYVVCDENSELIAAYQYINEKEKGSNKYPRIWPFDSTSSTGTTANELTAFAVNTYWECVNTIKAHLQPSVEIKCNVIDLAKLLGETPEYFNLGDHVYIRLPYKTDIISARITRTVKNPRKPQDDSIEIKTNPASFMSEFFKSYVKSSQAISIS